MAGDTAIASRTPDGHRMCFCRQLDALRPSDAARGAESVIGQRDAASCQTADLAFQARQQAMHRYEACVK